MVGPRGGNETEGLPEGHHRIRSPPPTADTCPSRRVPSPGLYLHLSPSPPVYRESPGEEPAGVSDTFPVPMRPPSEYFCAELNVHSKRLHRRGEMRHPFRRKGGAPLDRSQPRSVWRQGNHLRRSLPHRHERAECLDSCCPDPDLDVGDHVRVSLVD